METSESYLPMMEHVVGLGFKRCEEARKRVKKGEPKFRLVEACLRWWNSVRAFDMMLCNLQVEREELCHVLVRLNASIQAMSRYMKKHLGFSPILDLELDGTARNDKVPPGWHTLRYRHADPRLD